MGSPLGVLRALKVAPTPFFLFFTLPFHFLPVPFPFPCFSLPLSCTIFRRACIFIRFFIFFFCLNPIVRGAPVFILVSKQCRIFFVFVLYQTVQD